jgi:hypothetical protein
MDLDIRKDVRVDWITIESATERHSHMNKLFDTLGFQNTNQINGEIIDKENKEFLVIQQEKSDKVADSHILSLQKTGPVLILEDDCWFTSAFDPIIEVPDGADAIYLGTSVYGMVGRTSTPNGTKIVSVDDRYDKPMNMLGIHAVLYLTEEYKKRTIENLLNSRELGMYCDETVAIDMANHNIYSCVLPMLYQKDGHNDQVTTTPLRSIQATGPVGQLM